MRSVNEAEIIPGVTHRMFTNEQRRPVQAEFWWRLLKTTVPGFPLTAYSSASTCCSYQKDKKVKSGNLPKIRSFADQGWWTEPPVLIFIFISIILFSERQAERTGKLATKKSSFRHRVNSAFTRQREKCGRNCGNGAGFPQITTAYPCQYYLTSAPY
jgi:hypothetical protein